MRSNYFNNLREGSCFEYRSNGQLEWCGQFKNDERDGLWKYFNSNGVLEKSIMYKNGYQEDVIYN